jgi:hypothetical protein
VVPASVSAPFAVHHKDCKTGEGGAAMAVPPNIPVMTKRFSLPILLLP